MTYSRLIEFNSYSESLAPIFQGLLCHHTCYLGFIRIFLMTGHYVEPLLLSHINPVKLRNIIADKVF